MIAFSDKNIKDTEFIFDNLEENIKRTLRTGKHRILGEEEIEELKKYQVSILDKEMLELNLREMGRLDGEELIDYIKAREFPVVRKNYLFSDRVVNYSAVLVSEYIKEYGHQEIIENLDLIPPRFFNEVKEEIKSVMSNTLNSLLIKKAFLENLPAQISLFNDYFHVQKNRLQAKDRLIKEGRKERKRAEASSKLSFMMRYGPLEKPDDFLSYFTYKDDKIIYTEWCGKNLEIKDGEQSENIYEVKEPFTLDIATKDKIGLVELNMGDAIFVKEGMVHEIKEGYFYPEHFKHSKKFYEVLFANKEFEEVQEIVKEFDEDCKRVLLYNFEDFVRGNYEDLNLGQWYTELIPTLTDYEREILINDMKVYIDQTREELSNEYIRGKKEAPQSYYVNEILYGIPIGDYEGYWTLKCLDRLNDENLKYVIENFDKLSTKEGLSSRVLLDKYKVHLENTNMPDRTEGIEVDYGNKCLAFIEKCSFENKMKDLSEILAIYKLLKAENPNLFTREEKEAVDILTNGHSEEFFNKITLPNELHFSTWDDFFFNTKYDVKYYDEDTRKSWMEKYWEKGHSLDAKRFVLENCDKNMIPDLLRGTNPRSDSLRDAIMNCPEIINEVLKESKKNNDLYLVSLLNKVRIDGIKEKRENGREKREFEDWERQQK